MCGLLEQGESDDAEAVLSLGDANRRTSGFFAAWRHAAVGRLAAHRGEDARALEAFLAAGRGLTELLMVNPTLLAVALGRGSGGPAARPARAGPVARGG